MPLNVLNSLFLGESLLIWKLKLCFHTHTQKNSFFNIKIISVYKMMSIITMLFVHMPLKWHQTFSPLFRSLIFWITRLENDIRIVRIETYFLLVHFHLNTNLKILSYSFWTRKGLLIFFHHGTKLIDRSMNECQKHACLLGLSSAASTCRWAAWGAPGSHHLSRRSFHVLLQFQVEVRRGGYMCFILKLSTMVLFLAKRGLSYYPS